MIDLNCSSSSYGGKTTLATLLSQSLAHCCRKLENKASLVSLRYKNIVRGPLRACLLCLQSYNVQSIILYLVQKFSFEYYFFHNKELNYKFHRLSLAGVREIFNTFQTVSPVFLQRGFLSLRHSAAYLFLPTCYFCLLS